jgi:hypothetical protein
MCKASGDAVTTHALSGELYASKSGWILLAVPNALVRGAFDALNESGLELPLNSEGKLNSHISVMRPEELAEIGGVDKITERGHHFHYTLGPVQECNPGGWDEMSKVWFIKVNSLELQDLRKSYGLSPRPKNGEYDFHITIAVRRKNILRNNNVAKTANQEGINDNGMLESKNETEDLRNEETRFGHGEGRGGIGGEEGLWCTGDKWASSEESETITKIAAYYNAREAIRTITGS